MDIEKILGKRADLLSKGSESVKEWTLGSIVIGLIKTTGAVSVPAMQSELQRIIDSSASASGKAQPELDTDRVRAEAALAYLQELLADRRG